MRSRVLVTGATGFLGSHVVERLASSGRYEVHAVDVATGTRADALAALDGVEFTELDLRDTAALDRAVTAADRIVHLVAVRTQAAASRPRSAHEINVDATYDLLSLAARHGIRRVVLGSSHLVYGAFDDPDAAPFVEEQAAVRRGLSMYAASKLAAEALAEAFAGGGGAPYVALRYGTIYGPRANRDSNAGILLDVLSALDAGDRPSIPWQPDSIHALIHVDDAAEATVRALEVDGIDRTAINVVGPPVTAEQLYSTLVRVAGHDPAEIDWLNTRTRYQLVSASRLPTLLGVHSETDLTEALRRFVQWYRDDAGASPSARRTRDATVSR